MTEPRLYVGGLSGRVFCTTNYTEHANTVRAITKHDVTDDFERVALELGWVPPPAESDDE